MSTTLAEARKGFLAGDAGRVLEPHHVNSAIAVIVLHGQRIIDEV
ncbi:hypothetical protein TIFTF001_033801 [Ficus carica]|uniref:Uncharacterized protein n=1 Tax=Ficus carica TaxID=3494 RepID=A0AA88J825_FICCA|nr:hypothetical protein TIFTF001_033801 [Ficus carica]